MIDNFHLLRPLWLIALPIGIFMILFLWHPTDHNNTWRQICDPHLLQHLIRESSLTTIQYGRLIALTLWILGTTALAGPSWEKQELPLVSPTLGRVLILDLSRSMDSTDVKPSRLTRARFKLTDLIHAGASQLQGLVVYAGDAFVVSPLTDDTATLINLIPALSTNTVPSQGSRADLALQKAAQLIGNAELTRAEIILITDSSNLQTINTASSLRSQKIRTSVLAVGTLGGEPIQTADGGLLKDANGQIIIPTLDPKGLKQIANAGGGQYTLLSSDDSDIKTLSQKTELLDLLAMDVQDNRSILTSQQWLDRGPWLLLPMLLIAALSFRRGWILCLPLIILSLPQPVHAYDWRQLWLRQDQLAAQDFSAGKFEHLQQNTNPLWQGAARYRRGDFKGSIKNFRALNSSDGQYNLGNALAHAGQYKEAIDAYERALKLSPNMEDAKFNKQLIENLMQQQKQPDKKNKAQKQNADNKNQNQQSKGQKDEQTSSHPKSDENINNTPEQDLTAEAEQKNSQSTKKQNDKEEQQSKDNKSPPKDRQQTQIKSQQDKSSEQDSVAMATPRQDNPQEIEEKEQAQALTQWLRKIPDDPGGLLRRKFFLQQQQRLDNNPDYSTKIQQETQLW